MQRNVWFSSTGKSEQSSANPKTDTPTESQSASETTDKSTQEPNDQISDLLKGLEELKGKNDDLLVCSIVYRIYVDGLTVFIIAFFDTG